MPLKGDIGVAMLDLAQPWVLVHLGDRPIAAPDTYSTDEDVPLAVGAPGVMANDTNLVSETQAVLVRAPAHAAV